MSTGEKRSKNPEIKAEAQALALPLTAEIFGGTTDITSIKINGSRSDTISG